MKCPRCGQEMTLDGHRKIDLYMCYNCGYIEGRNMGAEVFTPSASNFSRLHGLNLNETASFLAKGLGLDENRVAAWLDDTEE